MLTNRSDKHLRSEGMTRDEIMALSGDELDKAVSEHIIKGYPLGRTLRPHSDIADAWFLIQSFGPYRIEHALRRIIQKEADAGDLSLGDYLKHLTPVNICRAALITILVP